MRYIVYTDGASSPADNVIGCAYLILTDTMFIKADSIRIAGMSNPTHAETISVGLAAAYFLDNVEIHRDDIIEFNIDCASAISFYQTYIENDNKIRSNVKPILNSVFVLRKLNSMCTVRFRKEHGHKNKINPNTCVDRFSKIAIRRN